MNLFIKPFWNSILVYYVGLLIFLLQSQIAKGQFKDYIDKKFCDIECGKRKHTLCESLTLPSCDKYKKFNIYEVKTLSNGKLLELLVNGHNGLRDRIANKAFIGNMVKVAWDEQLAQMAAAYFKQCEIEDPDPCTRFLAKEVTDMEKIEYKADPFENHRFIAQNRFRIEAQFFPKNFIEAALRSWYREKFKIPSPIFAKPPGSEYHIGLVSEENNFTRLAYPLIANFGCSIAQIDGYYELVCNYYPFYRSEFGFMVYLSSAPATNCPTFFPLKDEAFINLCGNGEELAATSFSLILMPKVLWYILLGVAEFVLTFM